MFITIIVTFISLIGLIVLHELGHFLLAKKFGVKVEEFGIGYPPRVFGKKIGETLYSINLLPFGAFVKIKGEEGGIEDYQSFVGKPMWQRILIVLGGVVSFWVVAAIILTFVAGVLGLPMAVKDEENHNLINPNVQIVGVANHSPASEAGLKVGDVIIGLEFDEENLTTSKVGEIQEFIRRHQGKEIILTIKSEQEILKKNLTPRDSPPEGEGPIGVALARIALKSYLWYQAPVQGIVTTAYLTTNIVEGWIIGLKNLLGIAKLPPGVKLEFMGPLGIFDLLRKNYTRGVNYFLYLISMISVGVALVNILPIPALDGGKLMFLGIEIIRKKPVSEKIEQNVTAIFFALLIILMIYITIKFDIPRVFLKS